MIDRMLFAEALETQKCIDEGVLTTTADANIGSIMGIGFPPYTGGSAQFIVGYQGPAGIGKEAFVARAKELAAKYGDRFTAAGLADVLPFDAKPPRQRRFGGFCVCVMRLRAYRPPMGLDADVRPVLAGVLRRPLRDLPAHAPGRARLLQRATRLLRADPPRGCRRGVQGPRDLLVGLRRRPVDGEGGRAAAGRQTAAVHGPAGASPHAQRAEQAVHPACDPGSAGQDHGDHRQVPRRYRGRPSSTSCASSPPRFRSR